jgi:hypothetical protein
MKTGWVSGAFCEQSWKRAEVFDGLARPLPLGATWPLRHLALPITQGEKGSVDWCFWPPVVQSPDLSEMRNHLFSSSTLVKPQKEKAQK